MKIAEDRILAYADGRLAADEAAEVERLISADEDAQALLAELRTSDLPYRAAAESVLQVPDLSAIAAQVQTRTARPRGVAPLWRHAAIAASLLIVFAAGIAADRFVFTPAPPTQWAVWVDRIASYQALYTRATLGMPTPPADRQARQMARVAKALGRRIAAPDLTGLKADFKYARLMAIDAEPLAQIAYLPATGEPFSLCMMRTAAGDHPPRFTALRGMKLATWRRDGIAYVLVGPLTDAQMTRYLEAIRRQQRGT